MANSRKPGPLQSPIGKCAIPARTPGPLGMFDQGDPTVTTALGDTPGPLGYNDAYDPSISLFGPALGGARRFSSLAELNGRSQIRAMSHGEAFFTFHPVGRALHGYAESALAITRSPLTLAEGVGNLLNDAYGYSKDHLAGPKTGVMGDARPYSAASGLVQSIQRDGWLGTTGNIVRGTILSLPGIAQIDALNRRDPHAFGASLPATFLALSGRLAAGQGGASRSGGTMVKVVRGDTAPAGRASNARGAQDFGQSALHRVAEENLKASAPGAVAGTNRAVSSFAASVEGPFSLLNRESRPVTFNQFVQHVEDSGLTSAFSKPLTEVYSEVYAVEKLTRPDPVTYLTGDFVTAHTERFVNGAARVDSTASFNARYLRDIEAGLPFGRPDAVFTSPATLIDKLYATGNPSIMESTLGFDVGTFSGAGSMTRTYIDNPTDVGLRFATGSEGGANPYWVPGGYTIKTTGGAGLPEMVTNQLPSHRVNTNIRVYP